MNIKRIKIVCFCGNDIHDKTKHGALHYIECPACGVRTPGYLSEGEAWSAWGWMQAKLGGKMKQRTTYEAGA